MVIAGVSSEERAGPVTGPTQLLLRVHNDLDVDRHDHHDPKQKAMNCGHRFLLSETGRANPDRFFDSEAKH